MVNNKENKYGKINFRWTPTENLDISFITTKFKRDDGSNNLNILYAPKEVTNNLEGYNKVDVLSHSLKIEYNFDNYNFESITTKRDYDMIFQNDFDFSNVTKMHQKKSSYTDSLAQEFRVSKKDDTFTWLLGIYGDDEDSGFHTIQDKLTGAGLIHVNAIQDLTSKTLGIFAHSTYYVNQKIALVTGIRYDKVDKTLKEKANNIDIKDSFSEISPKFSLKYKINKDVMTFFTIAKGFNPGGFNPHATHSDKKSFGSEKLISYEVGLKSSLFDNKITLNSTIYFIDISSLQTVHYINMSNFYMSNAAKGTSKGFEVELQAKATNEISLFTNFGYNDITFGNFSDIKGDYSGNVKPYAPKYNFSIGAQYRDASGYYARGDITGYGKMYTDNKNIYERKAYELVNVKIGYEKNNFDIYLYGKNIFDTNYDTHGFSNKFTVYSDPREIGVQLAYRF